MKSLQSLSSFKSYILRSFAVPVVPKYFFVGQRKLSIIHTRIRNKCSDLNYDLFSNHLRPDCACSCGYPIEDTEHYLFQCTQYTVSRRQLFNELRRFLPLNVTTLLFGSENLTFEDNSTIFLAVQSYIKATVRFTKLKFILSTLFAITFLHLSDRQQSFQLLFQLLSIHKDVNS